MQSQKKIKLLVLPAGRNIAKVIEKLPYSVDLTKGSFNNLEFVFEADKLSITHEGVDLTTFSFVWLSSTWGSRDLAYAVSLYLKDANVAHTYVEKGTSKITDHALFSLNNLEAPSTVFLNYKKIEENLDRIGKVCGYPLIIKSTKGCKGTDSAFARNSEELAEKVKDLPKNKEYLFQKFIENDYDWGVIVADGEIVSAEKSYPCSGEFRNHACHGAKEVFVAAKDVPEDIKQMAQKTSEALGLSWSRTDIVVDNKTQKPYLMEINRFPGLGSAGSEVDGAFKFLSSHLECCAK